MSDDTNKEVAINPEVGIQDNFKIETKPVEVKQPEVVETASTDVESTTPETVNEEVPNNEAQVAVEETKIEESGVDTPVSEVTTEEGASEANVVSETVIAADVNAEVKEEVVAVGTIDEVSVTVDSEAFNTLNENEISDKSVFKNPTTNTDATIMKEGMDKQPEKKGFPFFMVFIFALVVFAAFFIDDISIWIKEYRESKNKQPNIEEKEESKDKENDKTPQARLLTLSEIDEAMNNSSLLLAFETEKNVEVTSVLDANKLTYTTTNYIDLAGSSFKVEYTFENNMLVAVVDSANNDFGREMSIILVKEIAKKTKLSQKVTSEVLSATLEVIQKSVAKGNKVTLVGFGTFSAKKRAAREGINPLTKEPLKIPAKTVASFKAGSKLKDALN